jgi:hypothetical protein
MFLVGCSEIIITPTMEDIIFDNKTSDTLFVRFDPASGIETSINEFTITPDSTVTVQTQYGITPILIVSVVGKPSLFVRYKEYEYSSKIVFYSTYEYEVEYKISGSATSVNVTLSNSSGGTEQYSDVKLPKNYSYSFFFDNFLYISAQNNGSSGTVDVKCYYQGILQNSAHSEGAYVIATASYYMSN